jgi:Fe-S cluster assembly protein SufD
MPNSSTRRPEAEPEMPDGSTAIPPFLDLARAAAAEASPDWLATLRRTAVKAYAAAGLPGRRDEYWRYTNLNALAQRGYAVADTGSAPDASAQVDAVLAGLDGHRIVFVNGRLQPGLSSGDALPDGVRLAGLADMLATEPDTLQPWLGQIATLGGMPLAALNTAFIGDGMVLLVDAGVTLDRPILLISVGAPGATAATFQPRHLVVLGDGAAATLVEAHTGTDGGTGYFANIVTEMALGEGARLDHCKLQVEAASAHHLALTDARLARGAAYNGFVLQSGAAIGRHETRATLEGDDIECALAGVYLARDGQVLDNTTLVDHRAPAGRSRQVFKGVLDGKSRGVFQGKIHVRREAQRTDGHQLSRALLLSPNAEIDTRPELEIYADDVKCSHGATAGDLDETAMFYLLSRGIDRETARRLLVGAFVADALAGIRSPALADYFTARIDAWLDAHIGALPDAGDDIP